MAQHTDHGEILDNVEIMRIGTHTSSSGEKVTFGADEMAALAESYDPALHEAPVVLGHPADNQPAYGWVQKLRVVGDRLLATLDVVPEFVEAIKRGLYKKRSASIYKDLDGKGMYLRHVGFLGAVPPAVKALADIGLADSAAESLTIEYQEEEAMSWKEKVKRMFSSAVDEMPDLEANTGTPVPPPKKEEPAVTMYTEEQVKEIELKARKEAEEKAAAEFAEKAAKAEAEAAAKRHASEVDADIDRLTKAGKVIPAWVDGGLKQFAEAIPWQEVLSFGETDQKTPYQWLIEFLENLPQIVPLDEVAGGDNQKIGAAARLDAIVVDKLSKQPGMSYSAAFAEAQMENPDLAKEYASAVTGGGE